MEALPEWSKVVVLDTNMLLAPTQFKADVYEQLKNTSPGKQLVTLQECVDELVKVGERKGMKRKAKLAMEIVQAKHLRVVWIGSKKGVDELLLDIGRKGAEIATNDSQLKKKLKMEGVKVVFLRQRKKLDF